MPQLQPPQPGRLVISVAYNSMDALADCLKRLEKEFGTVQYETIDIPFTGEARHLEEMGSPLSRRFFSFEKMVARDKLADYKFACRKVEAQFADQVDETLFRTVNIDPCIMTPDNVTAASSHEMNHRVYLTRGVYAHIELIWSHERFVQLPWTNPDFTHDEAVDFFLRVREAFSLVEDKQSSFSFLW